ncbi:endonuclease/exonuclease/phosphatase family protein [Streptomyces kaniharaensis]|uniref:Endonuclease/exonuclease/phosphatase family protein n=1 Tax=Streptomyces kaniharaensis TaxID=212423 RepID=A0A6N7L2Q9_9ACTN|nr:endonuclease/exonuclease/phosphatase family protein [Streptomyces kaniharaensis]MQS17891.1 endonuclease/exonuclease/phosphatase family protein [Streptomyces kaniharaensis]
MILTIAIQNLQRGGLLDADGGHEDRWPLLAKRLAAVEPDLVLLQEAEGWETAGHRQLVRAERDLGMDGLIAPSRSGRGTALLYRRETLGRRIAWNTDYTADEMHHGFGVAGFDIGLPAPLAVASIHLTPYSADKAVTEADFAASRAYRHGPYCILGGDINYPPAAGPDPAWDRMRPYNRGTRTLLTDPALGRQSGPVPDRRVAWKLAANGLNDAAWHLYQQTGNEALLHRTGADDRIDQLWVSAPLAPAIVSYALLDTPADASDHHGLVVVLDTDLIDTSQPWAYR